MSDTFLAQVGGLQIFLLKCCILDIMNIIMISIPLVLSHRGPHPLHVPSFGGVGGQLLEAQGRRLGRETGVFKQAARFHTLLLQRLIVLVGEGYSLLLGAHAFCPEPVGIYACRYPSNWVHAERDKNMEQGGYAQSCL